MQTFITSIAVAGAKGDKRYQKLVSPQAQSKTKDSLGISPPGFCASQGCEWGRSITALGRPTPHRPASLWLTVVWRSGCLFRAWWKSLPTMPGARCDWLPPGIKPPSGVDKRGREGGNGAELDWSVQLPCHSPPRHLAAHHRQGDSESARRFGGAGGSESLGGSIQSDHLECSAVTVNQGIYALRSYLHFFTIT